MIKDMTSSVAALYDGGWRCTDYDELIAEYDLTDEEARTLCAALAHMQAIKEEATA